MEYANAASAQAPNQTMPELGKIKSAAERIAKVTERLDGFARRFHGPTPESPKGGETVSPPDCYRNDLETLFGQIDRLEIVACYLDTIG